MSIDSPTRIDTYPRTKPTIEDVYRVAEDLQFDLDNKRAAHIESIGKHYRDLTLAKEKDSWHQGGFPVFEEIGLEAGLATKIGDIEYPYVGINFRPKIDGKIQDYRVPPEYRYQMTYNVAISLQNYCLIAEAGFTRRPLLITGLTNIEMATLAKRVGFVISGAEIPSPGAEIPSLYGVEARYEDVLNLIFSERTLKLIGRVSRLISL